MALAAPQVFDHPLARVAFVDTGPAPSAQPAATARTVAHADGRSAPLAAPTLLFIHGALCDHRDWAPSLDHFSRRHRCVAMDLPGHGASPAAPSAIGIAAYARIVRDLASSLDLGRVVVVAHSMGCRVALQAAAGVSRVGDTPEAERSPTRPWPELAGLVLIDGAYLVPRLHADETPDQRRLLAQAARERAAALYATQAPAERAARGFGQMFFEPRFDALRDRMVERARALPPEVARTLMPDFAAWDVEHLEAVLPRVAAPMLALLCTFMNSNHERMRLDADTRTPWMAALERHVPGVTMRRIPDAGHFPMLEQPELTHALIDAWLTESTPTTKETAP